MDGEKTNMQERHTKVLYVYTGMFSAAKFLIVQRLKKILKCHQQMNR